jgi:hypothetical protein
VKQLPTQRFTAYYFLLSDCVLIFQYVWYGWILPGGASGGEVGYHRIEESVVSSDGSSDASPLLEEDEIDQEEGPHQERMPRLVGIGESGKSLMVVSMALVCIVLQQGVEATRICNKLLDDDDVQDYGHAVGQLLSWISGLLYFLSR